jgi:hypothetical protein
VEYVESRTEGQTVNVQSMCCRILFPKAPVERADVVVSSIPPTLVHYGTAHQEA